MLQNTFIHAPGVGPTTECRLWAAGIRTWRDLLRAPEDMPLRLRRRSEVCRFIEESVACLQRHDHRFFARHLPQSEHWRAFPEFRGRVAYLDIETTGLGFYDHVTVVGLFDGRRHKTFVRGDNLQEFPQEIAQYGLLVTFNGARFDLPLLRRAFRDLKFDQLHVDLRYALKRLGHSGGLKNIEQKLGIRRSPETAGLDGYDAVRLWRAYERGDEAALELLIRYNQEDVANLETLMHLAYEGLRLQRFGPYCSEHPAGM